MNAKDQGLRKQGDDIADGQNALVLKPPAASRLGVGGPRERNEKKLAALGREYEGVGAEHAKPAAEDPAIAPLDRPEAAPVAALRNKLIGKRLERARMQTLLVHSSPMAAQARATRLHEVEGEVAYLEERLRQLTAVEGNR